MMMDWGVETMVVNRDKSVAETELKDIGYVFMIKVDYEGNDDWCILHGSFSVTNQKAAAWKNGSYREIRRSEYKKVADEWVIMEIGGTEHFRGSFKDCIELLKISDNGYSYIRMLGDLEDERNGFSEADRNTIIEDLLK